MGEDLGQWFVKEDYCGRVGASQEDGMWRKVQEPVEDDIQRRETGYRPVKLSIMNAEQSVERRPPSSGSAVAGLLLPLNPLTHSRCPFFGSAGL